MMKKQTKGITQLHTARELHQFTVHGTDGEIGTVVDLVLSSTEWMIRYMLVNTTGGEEAAGSEAQILIPTRWIEEIAWQEQQVHVSLSCRQVKESPPIKSAQEVDRVFEERFYDYYQRRPYWLEESAVDEASWESFPASDPPARW